MLDESKFLEVMTVFCDLLGRPAPSKTTLSFFFESIKDMDTAAFTRRATEIMRSRKYTTLPTPADFLNLPDDQDTGLLAAETVLRVMERLGGDADVTAENFAGDAAIMATLDQLGGWVAACDAVREYDLDKLGIWRRDFAAIYRAVGRRATSGPRVLLGRHSQDNVLRGYLNPATGELRNALGAVIEVKPWAGKQIAGGAPLELPPAQEDDQAATEFFDAVERIGTFGQTTGDAPGASAPAHNQLQTEE